MSLLDDRFHASILSQRETLLKNPRSATVTLDPFTWSLRVHPPDGERLAEAANSRVLLELAMFIFAYQLGGAYLVGKFRLQMDGQSQFFSLFLFF